MIKQKLIIQNKIITRLFLAVVLAFVAITMFSSGVMAQASVKVYDYESGGTINSPLFFIRERTCNISTSDCSNEVRYHYASSSHGYRFNQTQNTANYITVSEVCEPEKGVLQKGLSGGQVIQIRDTEEFNARFGVGAATCTPAEPADPDSPQPGDDPTGTATDPNPTEGVDGEFRISGECNERPLDRTNCPIIGYILDFTNALSALVGIVAVIMIAWGGFRYITSHDNPQWAKAGRDHVMWAAIALIMYLFLYAFLQWIIPGGFL